MVFRAVALFLFLSVFPGLAATTNCLVINIAASPDTGVLIPAHTEKVAHADGGPELKLEFPEVHYKSPPFLATTHKTWQPTRGPELLRWSIPQPKPFQMANKAVNPEGLRLYLEQSPRFRGRAFEMKPLNAGGMATVFEVRFPDTGERLAVKVFNPSRPYFSGDHSITELRRKGGEAEVDRLKQNYPHVEGRAFYPWETTTGAMIQRQLALQGFLQQVIANHEKAVPADKGRFSVSPIDTDPYFINAGIMVQPFETGRIAELHEVDPTARALLKVVDPYGANVRRITDERFGPRNVSKESAPDGIDWGAEDFENIRVYDGPTPRAVLIDW